MTAPNVYKSTDASAPAKISGVAGSLVTVLDACLVGSGGVAYGAKASAGWTIAFTAANRRVYRMTTTGATGFYLDVNDAGPGGVTLGMEAFCRGYEIASGVGAGTNPFPTVAQQANGIAIRKKGSPDATATDSPWVVIADDKTVYVFIDTNDFPGYSGFMFGDFFSFTTGDAYRCAIIGRAGSVTGSNVLIAANSEDRLSNLVALTAAATGHYAARAWHGGVAGAIAIGKHGDAAHSAATLAGLFDYPNPKDGLTYLSQVKVHDLFGSFAVARGRLRGFWHFLHPAASPVNDGDTPSGGGALAGKTFLVLRPNPQADGVFVMETSNTWETSS
jgi:hypothetical protein